jgi:TolB protein
MRTRILLAIGATAALLGCTLAASLTIEGPAAAAASFPGQNGKIAFARDTGTPAIYVMNADGSKPHRIAASGSDAPAPSWSADGSKLAFVKHAGRSDEIYVSDARGKHLQRLTSNRFTDGAPTWSPDGTKIAFTHYGAGIDIFVMDADGKHQVNLTNTPDSDEDEATWSPDGTKIVFTSLTDSSHSSDGSIHITVDSINPDGTGRQTLAANGSLSSPNFSPDGTRIAYQATVGDVTAQIYVMNADGTNTVDLTNQPDEIFFSPWWSPDGTKILFHTARLDSALDSQIYVMQADGTNPTALTEQPGTIDRHASWQPILAP